MPEDDKRERKIKVTDKRMFTADGKLREGFQHLEGAEPPASLAEPSEEPEPPADEPVAQAPPPPAEPTGSEDRARVDMPETPGTLGQPGFTDLVGVLAEPIAIYLGDAKLPDGGSAENLDAARFYIDLLEVLRTRTSGNLTPQESSLLEDLLYQLRMRYVRKQG